MKHSVKTLALYFIGWRMLLCFTVLPLIRSSVSENSWIAAELLSMLVVCVTAGILEHRKIYEDLNAFLSGRKRNAVCILGAVSAILAVQAVFMILMRSAGMNQIPQSAVFNQNLNRSSCFGSMMISVLLTPFLEETVWRVSLIQVLERYMKRSKAGIMSSILFGLSHVLTGSASAPAVSLCWLIFYAVCGWILFLAEEKSGSVFTSVIAHAAVNLASMVI